MEAEADLLLEDRLGDTGAARRQAAEKVVDDTLVHSQHCCECKTPPQRSQRRERLVLAGRGQRSKGNDFL